VLPATPEDAHRGLEDVPIHGPSRQALSTPGESRDELPAWCSGAESEAKSWSAVYYRCQRKRLTLGPVKKLSLAGARAEAKRIRWAVAIGQDEAIKLSTRATRAGREGKGGARGEDVRHHYRTLACGGIGTLEADDKSRLDPVRAKEIAPALGTMAPEQIKPSHIQALIGRIEKGRPGPKDKDGSPNWKRKPAPVSARRCFEVVRRLFVWCVAKGIVESPPCDSAKFFERSRKSGKKRDGQKPQPFTDAQLRAIHKATRESPEVGFYDLIMLTGVRAHEARSAKFEDVDERRKLWTVPAELHKVGAETGHPHIVPLSDAALAIVTRAREATAGDGWLFPAPTSSCEACEQPGHLDKPRLAVVSREVVQ
jgi:hypothetical protein